MSFVGGSLRLALKKSLAEASLASKPSEKGNAKRKKKKELVEMKKRRNKQIRQKINQDRKLAAACRKAQQQHLGIKSTTSEKHVHRMSSFYGKGSKRSNRSITSSSSLSSSSSSSDETDNDSDSSTSNSINSSSSSSAQRNMFDTSSSDEMDIDDRIKDSSDNSEHIVSGHSVEELMRNDPPSACPKHLLITPPCIMDNDDKPERKRKQEETFNDHSTLNHKEKKNKKNEECEIKIIRSKKSPRSALGSASDRSATSKISSSSTATRRAKSRTCSPPSIDVLRWVDSMSASKSRKNICAGTRVKVRFVTRSSRKEGKKFDPTRIRVKWYGGCVSEVFNDGKRVRIHYDDGTSEVSDFPDDDVVVDDTENGAHKKNMKAFIPSVVSANHLKNKYLTSTSQNTVLLSDEQNNDSIAPSAHRINRGITLTQESCDQKESKLLTSSKKTIHKEKIKEQYHIDSTNDRLKKNSQLHVSPPSTKASTVTESSFSLSSNNNSANEYSESSCSIASHELISTSYTKKIEPSHSPSHNNFEQLGEQNDRYSPISEPLAGRSYPKIKISNSLNKTEKAVQPLDKDRHLIRHSTSSTLGDVYQEDSGKVSKVNSSLSIKLDVYKTKKDSKQTFPASSFNRDKENISSEFLCNRKSNDISEQKVDHNFRGNVGESIFRQRSSELSDDCASHSQNTTTNVSEIDEMRRSPTLSMASKITPVQFEKKTNINREKKQQNHSGYGSESFQNSSTQIVEAKEIDMESTLNLNPISNYPETHEKCFKEKKQNIDLPTNPDFDERKTNVTQDKSTNEGDVSSTFSTSPELTPCKTDKNYDRPTSFTLRAKLSLTEEDYTESPRSIYKDKLDNCDSISLAASLASDDNVHEKSSPVLSSRSGRLAAQKANRRIVSKQEEVADEFIVRKRKRERLETRKSTESLDLSSFDSNNAENDYDAREHEDGERWVQCDRCMKWRLLPKCVKMDKLPEHWFCELNIHDSLRNRCDAPEQTIEEISNEKKQVYDFSTESNKNKKQTFIGDERKKASCSFSPSRQTRKNISSRTDGDDGLNLRKNAIKTTKNFSPPYAQNNKSSSITQPQTVRDEASSKKNSNKLLRGNTRIMPVDSCSTDKDFYTGTGSRPKNQSRYRGNRRDQEKTGKGSKSKNKGKTESQEWVQCEKCEKWRKLPPRISAKDLPEKWFCHMNTWDFNSASCAVAEDKLDVIQNNTVSSRSTLRSSGGGKLSYRNLIFGTGKRNLRYTSERARVTESLFSQGCSSSSEQFSTLAYSESSAFVSKQGKVHEQSRNISKANLSVFNVLSNSKLWDELYGPKNCDHQSSVTNKAEGLCKLQSQCIDNSFPEYDRMKDLVYSVICSTPMNAHQLCLAVQYNACISEEDKHQNMGKFCTIDRVCSVLDDLFKEGYVSKFKLDDNIDMIYSVQYFRAIKSSSSKSRCMKISKPWKHTSSYSGE